MLVWSCKFTHLGSHSGYDWWKFSRDHAVFLPFDESEADRGKFASVVVNTSRYDIRKGAMAIEIDR
jgi:hypothetical protein